MASYNVRVYLNTGFNAVNIPDSPYLLESCSYFDTTAVGVMQGRLSSIRVRTTWSAIENADYLRLTNGVKNYYFSIPSGGIKMLANDTAEISLVYDYVLSAGGVNAIEILDGVTTRVHVTDDTFGRYAENDPLTMPAQPLEIQTVWFNPKDGASQSEQGSHTYIEATVNLPGTGLAREGRKYTHVATAQGEENESVIVPTVTDLGHFTSYVLDDVSDTVEPHTMLYDLNDTSQESGASYNNQQAILMGMSRVRELGIEEGAIVNQVSIPLVYAQATSVTSSLFHYRDPDTQVDQTTTDKSILTFKGKRNYVASGIPYEYSNARNNRVNYGEYTKYGLITCSGESCEFNAEDIKDPQNPTSPVLKFVADPHSDGKPYFRWRYVNGDSSNIGFFRNCIGGLQWKQVPLFFSKVSGSALNTLKYQNSRNFSNLQYENRSEERLFRAKSGIVGGAIQGGVNGLSSGGIGGAIGGVIGGTIGSGISAMNIVREQATDDIEYAAQKHNEMSDYLVNNTVAAPTINFPYNSEVMRDFYGNGCMMYRYKYSNSDISRIDKLLSMYGYRYTKPLEKTDFTSKQLFNYVECANISIGGSIPKWMADGVALMLRNGVRVWHTLPNPALYTQINPNS